MSEEQFKAKMLESEVFQNFENFKKSITLKRKNIQKLLILYQQAERYGINYLKQNQNLMSSEVLLIENMLSL